MIFWIYLVVYGVVYFAAQVFAWVVNHLFRKVLLSYRPSGIIAVILVAGVNLWWHLSLLAPLTANASPFMQGRLEGRAGAECLFPALVIIACVGYRVSRERQAAKKSGNRL